MLKRKATAQFEAWRRTAPGKALLVKGARQVGKTYLIERFARDNFEHVVKFDMIEDGAVRSSFAAATSADDLFLRMSVAASEPMVPGKTVVFVDEAQGCPNVVTFIKYLVQKGDFSYILSGSLLGVSLENIDSLPVGYVTQVEMFPLDFEEFCWASGISEDVWGMARALVAEEKPLPDFLYARLLGLFHRYAIVGGMPDAVATFLGTNNIDAVRSIHANIHALYRADITKYAPVGLRPVIRDIYDLIPSEAGSKNRRFKLSSIEGVKRFEQVTDHFLWLANAGVALPVYNVTAPITPLLVGEQRNMFKLFYLDTGMLMSSYPKRVAQGVLDGGELDGGGPGGGAPADANVGFAMNMGAAYEGFVAQELKAHGFKLRYFTSKKVGELDFLAEQRDGDLLALEVKSGASYLTHAALDNALKVAEYTIDEAVVLAETNVRRQGRILYLPIFMVGTIGFEG